MPDYEIYHNPRCSKSRATLKLLQEKGVEPTVRLYLENPPSAAELKRLLKMLELEPRSLIRDSEDEYRELDLSNAKPTNAKLIEAMTAHPRLIQRPIVIRDNQSAAIGRPPEAVLSLLD